MKNRIIKFRAWDKKRKIMVGTNYPKNWANDKDEYFADWVNIELTCIENINANKEFNVMQFTGLLDINGKEIYEGDVFKDEEWWVEKAKIEFYEGAFGWWSDGKELFISLNNCKHIEIIGNIFEHANFFK